MAASVQPACAQNPAPRSAAIPPSDSIATTRPMNKGISASIKATSSPAANRAANNPRACRAKYQ